MPYLSHFTNVTTLAFANLATGVFHAVSLVNCFKPFITTVRTLRLCRPITRPTSLVQIILLFSAAVDVQIAFPQWSLVDENVTLHPPLQGEIEFTGVLYLRGFGEKWPEFFTLLSARRLGSQNLRLHWGQGVVS